MGRRDYQRIADGLREEMPTAEPMVLQRRQWVDDCKAVASALAHGNARFIRSTFLRACGLTEGEY